MIVGIGTDLCVIERFRGHAGAPPRPRGAAAHRGERRLSIESQAARFAAKEAFAKALGSPGGMRWLDCEVVKSDDGDPAFRNTGSVAARVEALGIRHIHLSISHDGGFATAMVVCEA